MEIWKDIKGYEGYYQVSNLGNVKSLDRIINKANGAKVLFKGKLKNKVKGGRGYLFVSLCKDGNSKRTKVHKIVCESFFNHKYADKKMVINHINFDKCDNRLSNLEIITQRENANQKHLKSTSKYVGVNWSKQNKKWLSRIRIKGTQIYLGYFNCEIEASNAYKKALSNVR